MEKVLSERTTKILSERQEKIKEAVDKIMPNIDATRRDPESDLEDMLKEETDNDSVISSAAEQKAMRMSKESNFKTKKGKAIYHKKVRKLESSMERLREMSQNSKLLANETGYNSSAMNVLEHDTSHYSHLLPPGQSDEENSLQ